MLKLLPCVLIAALSELARVTVFLMVTLRAFAGVFIVFTAILATAERAVRLRIVKRTGALFVFRVLTSALSVVDKERTVFTSVLSVVLLLICVLIAARNGALFVASVLMRSLMLIAFCTP